METKKKKQWLKRNPSFDSEFEKIENMLNEMLDQLMETEAFSDNQPHVVGFAFRLGEDGKPVAQEFSDIRHSQEPEPLVETQKREQSFLVTMELPGIQKHDVDLKIEKKSIAVSAWNETKNYFKLIALPEEIAEHKTKAVFNNGILEIEAFKKNPVKPTIPIQ